VDGWYGILHTLVQASWSLAVITSAEEFVLLRSSSDPREYLRAASEEAPDSVWRDVIDRFPEYRVWVAYNKTVPQPILEILVADPDPRVRWQVASKRSLSVQQMERLAKDEDDTVRGRLVNNKKLTREVLQILADDRWDRIREIASIRLNDIRDS
jgi:hypothetical protein